MYFFIYYNAMYTGLDIYTYTFQVHISYTFIHISNVAEIKMKYCILILIVPESPPNISPR